MGTSSQSLCISAVVILCISAYFVRGSDKVICTDLTYYKVKKNGKAICRACQPCASAGYGLNTTVKRLENEHGFLSCYLCERCPPETFRKFDTKEPHCRTCTLDCLRLNRYGSVRCGGANQGHCGECKHGFNAESKEPNSICNRPKVKDKPITISPETDPITQTVHTKTPPEAHDIHTWIPRGILYLLVLAPISLGVVLAVKRNCYRCREKKTTSENLAKKADSSKALINSNGSSIGEDNLETDGDGQAKGELPTVVSINELEAMVCNHFAQPRPVNAEQHVLLLKYINRVLNKEDETLTVVADNVSGEKRHELFQTYLKMEKPKTDPEEERWLSGMIPHTVYVLNVLMIWLQREGENATLRVLCNALVMANFDFIVKKILDLPENEVPPSTVLENTEIKELIEIVL